MGGGLGHLTRAIGLARHAQRRGHRVTIFTNSPFAAAVTSSTAIRTFESSAPDAIAAAIEALSFDALVVDTFPRGLGGELAPLLDTLAVPKVLVHRDLDPRYVKARAIASWVARYDLVLVPGEDAPCADAANAVRTPPWLSVDADALLPREAAQRELGVEGPAVAVLANGRHEEGAVFAGIAERLREKVDAEITLLTPVPRPDLIGARVVWPFLRVIRGVDVIVGGGGYNTVNEARATHTPFVGVAFARKYDRQHVRLREEERARDEGEVIASVAHHLARTTTRRDAPCFEDGAAEAAARIDRLLSRSTLNVHRAAHL